MVLVHFSCTSIAIVKYKVLIKLFTYDGHWNLGCKVFVEMSRMYDYEHFLYKKIMCSILLIGGSCFLKAKLIMKHQALKLLTDNYHTLVDKSVQNICLRRHQRHNIKGKTQVLT